MTHNMHQRLSKHKGRVVLCNIAHSMHCVVCTKNFDAVFRFEVSLARNPA